MGDSIQVVLSVQAREYSYDANPESMKFFEEVRPRLGNVPIICWTRTCKAFDVPLSEFTWDKLTRCKIRYSGKYDPEAMLETVERVVKEKEVQKFEFVLIIGCIDDDYNWQSFGDKLKASSFYTSISLITLHMLDINPDVIETKFLQAFHGLPLKMHFEKFVIEIEKQIEAPRLTLRSSYHYHRFLDNLGKYIYINSTTKAERKSLIQVLENTEKSYFEDIRQQNSSLNYFGGRCSNESLVRSFVEKRRWAKLRNFYDHALRRQFLLFAQYKFIRLYDLLQKSEVSFNDFKCFVPNHLYSSQGRESFNIVNKEEEANTKEDSPERVPLCVLDQMDPEAPAIHYESNTTVFYRDNSECDECPFLLLEHFNLAWLNKDITCYKRAGDYKKPEVKEDLEDYSEYQRTGVILYKFQNLDDPYPELLKPKTREDEVIVETIRAFIDWRWGVKRNRGLVAIVFLFALYITDKVQNDEFMKKCVRYTIIRLSLVFKCNLPIFKSEFPHIYVRIYDALMYAVHVSCMETNPSKNFYNRLKAAGPYFVFFMDSIFQQKFPQPINVKCWLALDYMTKIADNDKNVTQGIAMTKVVGWTHTSKGPLLLRGKQSDKCYHELLDGLSATDVFKLKKFIDDDVNLYSKKFDFALADIDIAITVPSVKSESGLEDFYYKHVRICHSTCRPTILCHEKIATWKECVPKEFRQSHLSFFQLFGKYCKEYGKYPTDTDMMGYLVKCYPLETFYQNTQEILMHVTEEFKRLKLEIDTFLERFDKSKSLEKRKQIEADCKCPAHIPPSTKHPQVAKPMNIYVLVLVFLILFIIVTCWLCF